MYVLLLPYGQSSHGVATPIRRHPTGCFVYTVSNAKGADAETGFRVDVSAKSVREFHVFQPHFTLLSYAYILRAYVFKFQSVSCSALGGIGSPFLDFASA